MFRSLAFIPLVLRCISIIFSRSISQLQPTCFVLVSFLSSSSKSVQWFTSAPMCDGFLTLAKISPTGASAAVTAADPKVAPSCFLVPRWVPTTGERNSGFQVMRLKDKLGDRANASSEVEYRGAWGQLVGEPGKGVKTIIEMVQSTRLDCILGSAGAARRALQISLNHAVRTVYHVQY